MASTGSPDRQWPGYGANVQDGEVGPGAVRVVVWSDGKPPSAGVPEKMQAQPHDAYGGDEQGFVTVHAAQLETDWPIREGVHAEGGNQPAPSEPGLARDIQSRA